ncbi:RsmB/NOP family class I SAM-dependent RNA methyltransferase [Companilactobacillus baiquanensis]|uniref:RsmB/NOP family class I SAM-dependent RNA methyltransferase n=1 Tax=Companilactobacillus baiquanensis TaxID=2486005 RepID=A0ABW1UUX2_9LACO|nr:RsmF rRNA methyltransferase first C-terminal domain-containing protein [Companilactobacillus baiquanensis]
MRVNLSEDFKTKYKELLGDRAESLFQAIEVDSKNAFRLNPLKNNYQNVQYKLDQPIEYSKFGYFGDIDGNSIDHLSGYVYSQEPSAMYVAEVVDPKDEKVLDLCAAPGSKTTYLASLMGGSGLLVSNEINNKRARVLSSNVERMGIKNAIVINNSPKDLEGSFEGYFDKILVDAPCSGEGMFRKDPESVQYWSPEYVEQCANRQKHILDSAFFMLKDGGTLVYSTCTFAPEENENNIAEFVKRHPEMEIVPIKKYSGMEDGRPEWGHDNQDLTKALRMFPDKFDGEGHFICKMIKAGVEKSAKIRTFKNQPTKIEMSYLDKFIKQNLTSNNLSEIFKVKEDLYQAATFDNRFKKLHVLRNGLKLGEFKKNRFEPSISWMLTLKPDDLKSVYELDDDQFIKYLHGESVLIENDFSNKWIGLSYQGKLFSWGRYSNKQIKNVYPKGLRK